MRKKSCRILPLRPAQPDDVASSQNPDLLTAGGDIAIERLEASVDGCLRNNVGVLGPTILETVMHLTREAGDEARHGLNGPALLALTSDQTRPQDDCSLEAQLLDILLELTLHAGVRDTRRLAGSTRRHEHVHLGPSIAGSARQLQVQVVVQLVLILEPTRRGAGRAQRGDEDRRGWGQGCDLARPARGVAVDDGRQLRLGRGCRGGRGAARDGVEAGDAGVGEQGGEDVGALRSGERWRYSFVIHGCRSSFVDPDASPWIKG